MQTFLPYADFQKSAQCLDRARLGKQRVECLQILQALTGERKGWTNHPATKMWKGNEVWLVDYAITICREWLLRGYKDTCLQKIHLIILNWDTLKINKTTPCWLGDQDFHDRHKSNLLRKAPEHYQQFNWDVPDNLPYRWL
jgi:hypothetical protein